MLTTEVALVGRLSAALFVSALLAVLAPCKTVFLDMAKKVIHTESLDSLLTLPYHERTNPNHYLPVSGVL